MWGGHITARHAINAETRQQNVLFVGATSRPIIMDASTTINLYTETTGIELPQHKPHLQLLPDMTKP